MRDEDRRLAALAALFAPDRASALVARLAGAAATEVSREAARLAAASRRERLDALGAAVAARADRPPAAAFARGERPAVARVLRTIVEGVGDPASPALVRLCRERLGR